MSWLKIMMGVLLFGAGTFILPKVAADPEHAPAILTILGTAVTSWICSVLTLFSALFTLLFVLQACLRALRTPELKLGLDALVLPQGLFSLPKTIPYASIDRVWEVTPANQVMLMIQAAGRKFNIPAGMLPDVTDYESVRDHLRAVAADAPNREARTFSEP